MKVYTKVFWRYALRLRVVKTEAYTIRIIRVFKICASHPVMLKEFSVRLIKDLRHPQQEIHI